MSFGSRMLFPDRNYTEAQRAHHQKVMDFDHLASQALALAHGFFATTFLRGKDGAENNTDNITISDLEKVAKLSWDMAEAMEREAKARFEAKGLLNEP